MPDLTDMRVAAILGLAGCAASFAAGLLVGRGAPPSRGSAAALPWGPAPELEPSVISIITPVIGPTTAEDVLSQIERLPAGPATLVLHTYGGALGSCVLIADAVRKLPRCTAVIPYVAASGGTLIALSASVIAMGANASLSAVDPIVRGHRVRHIPDTPRSAKIRARGREYEAAVSRYVRGLLDRHLHARDEVARAMSIFMGEDAPHEWPIRREEARALGLPVVAAAKKWSGFVDQLRERELIWP